MPSTEDNKTNYIDKSRKLLFIPVAVFVLLIAIGSFFYFDAVQKQKLKNYYYAPGTYSQSYIDQSNKILEQEKPKLEEGNNISLLRKKLPYKGKYFSMFFDYNVLQYFATISKANKAAGDQEFNDFLNANGIKNKDSFTNLVIEYK